MPDQGSTVVIDWFADDATLSLWARLTGQTVVRGPKPAEVDTISVVPASGSEASTQLAIGGGEATPQGRTTSDGIELAKILRDRPDVFQAFFTEYYGPNNDHHSHAWVDRVGGATPEDYANYWYETYGKTGGYAGAPARAPAEAIDYDQLLRDRPDVFQAAFTEYWGPNNDRHSHAWVDRVGGTTPQDYARYWYETYGKSEGYTQRAPAAPPAPEPDPSGGGGMAEEVPPTVVETRCARPLEGSQAPAPEDMVADLPAEPPLELIATDTALAPDAVSATPDAGSGWLVV